MARLLTQHRLPVQRLRTANGCPKLPSRSSQSPRQDPRVDALLIRVPPRVAPRCGVHDSMTSSVASGFSRVVTTSEMSARNRSPADPPPTGPARTAWSAIFASPGHSASFPPVGAEPDHAGRTWDPASDPRLCARPRHRCEPELTVSELVLHTRDPRRPVSPQRRDRFVSARLEEPPHRRRELRLGLLHILRCHGNSMGQIPFRRD